MANKEKWNWGFVDMSARSALIDSGFVVSAIRRHTLGLDVITTGDQTNSSCLYLFGQDVPGGDFEVTGRIAYIASDFSFVETRNNKYYLRGDCFQETYGR